MTWAEFGKNPLFYIHWGNIVEKCKKTVTEKSSEITFMI